MSAITPLSASPSGSTRAFESSGMGPAPAASPADVKRAAAQFEAILLRQLLSPAVEPMMNGSLAGGGGAGGGVYGYMLTDVLANTMSQGGGLGLASVLEKQFSAQTGSTSSVSPR